MTLTVMYFGMRAELLVRCERLGASLVIASTWFCARRCMCRADMRSQLVMLSESLVTGTFCALWDTTNPTFASF